MNTEIISFALQEWDRRLNDSRLAIGKSSVELKQRWRTEVSGTLNDIAQANDSFLKLRDYLTNAVVTTSYYQVLMQHPRDDHGNPISIDLIPQTIVVLGRDGKAIFANRVALEYTGLSLDEVRADNFRDRVFHPEDVQRLCEERQRGLSGSVPFENEQRARGKDGKCRWFLIRYNPLLDERGNVIRWYVTGTDIEDRKQAENKLRQDEGELRQLIDFLLSTFLSWTGKENCFRPTRRCSTIKASRSKK